MPLLGIWLCMGATEGSNRSGERQGERNPCGILSRPGRRVSGRALRRSERFMAGQISVNVISTSLEASALRPTSIHLVPRHEAPERMLKTDPDGFAVGSTDQPLHPTSRPGCLIRSASCGIQGIGLSGERQWEHGGPWRIYLVLQAQGVRLARRCRPCAQGSPRTGDLQQSRTEKSVLWT